MRYKLIITFLFSCSYFVASAQNDTSTSFIKCVEEYYGTSNLLLNGRLYKKKHPRASGNPYFKFEDWTLGTIYINGVAYPNELLKFDLVQNEVVLKKILKNGISNQVILNENIVDSFSIEQHLFITNAIALDSNGKRGFTEKIYSSDFQFYRKQSKKFDGVFSDRQPHGNFTLPTAVFFMKKNGEVISISKRNDLLDQFDEHRYAIKKMMKKNKIKLKKASNLQLTQLMKFIDDVR